MRKKTGILCGLLMAYAGWSQETNLEWTVEVKGAGSEYPVTMVTTDEGVSYIVGTFSGTVDFDPGPGVEEMVSTDYPDIFIQKLNSAGELVWVKQIAGPDYKFPKTASLSHEGNLVITGDINKNLDVDPGPDEFWLTSAAENTYDPFILQIHPSGEFAGAMRFNGAELPTPGWPAHIRSIAYLPSGEFYIAGGLRETINFGTDADPFWVTPGGYSDFFVQKRATDGSLVWHKQIGGDSYDSGQIALAEDGSILASGYFKGTVDFNPGAGEYELTANDPSGLGGADHFLLKLTGDGDFIWAKSFGGPEGEGTSSITLGPSGAVYVCGYFSETSDFDPGPAEYNLTSNGGQDVFLAKYTTDGDFMWAKSIGGSDYDSPYILRTDADEQLYFSGIFTGIVDLDPGPALLNREAIVSTDIFLLKLNEDGGLLWAGHFEGGSLSGEQLAFDIDDAENVYGAVGYGDSIDTNPDLAYEPVSSIGYTDYFAFKLNTTGTLSVPQATVTANQLTVYPNPSGGQVSFRFDRPLSSPQRLIVLNELGQVVHQNVKITEQVYILEKGVLDAGIYTAVISDENKMTTGTKRFVIY